MLKEDEPGIFYGLFCWGCKKAYLASSGNQLVWAGIMEEFGCSWEGLGHREVRNSWTTFLFRHARRSKRKLTVKEAGCIGSFHGRKRGADGNQREEGVGRVDIEGWNRDSTVQTKCGVRRRLRDKA